MPILSAISASVNAPASATLTPAEQRRVDLVRLEAFVDALRSMAPEEAAEFAAQAAERERRLVLDGPAPRGDCRHPGRRAVRRYPTYTSPASLADMAWWGAEAARDEYASAMAEDLP